MGAWLAAALPVLGLLDCNVEGDMGFIIGSQKNLTCTFTSANKEIAPENYVGVIKKLGLDIGATRKAVLRWRVLAPTGNPMRPACWPVTTPASALKRGGEREDHQDHYLAAAQCRGADRLNVAAGVTSFQLRAAK